LDKAVTSGAYTVLIGSDSHSNEPTRQAEIEVRFIKASVKAPTRNQTTASQTLYAIEAREVNSIAKEPVLWRLITNWPIENFD